MRWLHSLRRLLSPATAASTLGLFHHHTRVFCRAQVLIRAFYAFMVYLIILLIPEWEGITHRPHILPLWPVEWLNHVPLHEGIFVIMLLFTGGSLVAAFLPQLLMARVLAFLGVFQYWAFNNSFGKVGHSLHWTVLVSFVLIFLPKGWHRPEQRSRLVKQTTLLTFWAAQATMALTYTMAGIIKIVGGFSQLAHGQPNLFSPDALARHVADRLLETNSQSMFGAWLIDHFWLFGPLFLGTVYMETFFLLTVFRPRLQLAFVVGLVCFHIGSYLTMTIIFPQNCFLMLLFFAGMPLLRGPWTWRGFWSDWPIVGDLWLLWKKRVS